MPVYVYACRSCESNFEVKQSFTDDALTTCNACGGPVRRVLQPVGIVFKGNGWYVTDSRKTETAAVPSAVDDKKSSDAPAEKSEKSEKAEKSEKSEKSDAKPAPAAAPAAAAASGAPASGGTSAASSGNQKA
jgi:putative FmdB family regulatory protein